MRNVIHLVPGPDFWVVFVIYNHKIQIKNLHTRAKFNTRKVLPDIPNVSKISYNGLVIPYILLPSV